MFLYLHQHACPNLRKTASSVSYRKMLPGVFKSVTQQVKQFKGDVKGGHPGRGSLPEKQR